MAGQMTCRSSIGQWDFVSIHSGTCTSAIGTSVSSSLRQVRQRAHLPPSPVQVIMSMPQAVSLTKTTRCTSPQPMRCSLCLSTRVRRSTSAEVIETHGETASLVRARIWTSAQTVTSWCPAGMITGCERTDPAQGSGLTMPLATKWVASGEAKGQTSSTLRRVWLWTAPGTSTF